MRRGEGDGRGYKELKQKKGGEKDDVQAQEKKGKGPQERNEVAVTIRSKSYQGEGKCEHEFNVVDKLFLLGRKEGNEKKVLYQSTFPIPI